MTHEYLMRLELSNSLQFSNTVSCIQWNLSIVDTTGTQLTVLYTVDLSIEDTIETELAVLYTVEPLYRGHYWDPADCPVYSETFL